MSPTYDKRLLLKSAYNYAQSSQWDKALEEYRRISKLFPDDPNVYSMIADLLMKKSDPAGAMGSHLEAARQFKNLGNDDKELAALRKAQRVQSGNSEVASRLDNFFQRAVAKASQSLAAGKLQEAEELASKLLDADPGHLQANRLIDDIRAKKLQEEASKAFQEEERLAVNQAPAVDATKEVMLRLRDTADKYLKAEDYDNAVETLLIMLKIDPGKHEIRQQLDQAQEQLKKKQQAQVVWQNILAADSQRMDDVKEQEMSAKDMEEWAQQEQAVRERLAAELAAAEEAAKAELDIIEKAVQEIRNHKGAGSAAATVSPSDESRLRALEGEKRMLEANLRAERDEAPEREKDVQEQVRRESELLRHAIEMERMEVEAKAKALALKEIESKLESERRQQEAALAAERQRSAQTEEALRKQLQDLMREEMARMRDEMQSQALQDVKRKLDEEKALRERTEKELTQKQAETLSAYETEQRRAGEERSRAEEAVLKERAAIQALKSQEDARKTALVEEALKRRSTRVGGASQEKKDVMKASRRISDALHAAATKHLESDVDGMLETASRYLQQDLLLDAMRICQKIAVTDPQNEKVKALLKEIYVRKGL